MKQSPLKSEDDIGISCQIVDINCFIKNLDTGDVFSVADFGTIDVQLSQFSQKQSPHSSKWSKFWNKMNELNESLWDACERGQYDVVLPLLTDQNELKNQVIQSKPMSKSSMSSFSAEEYQECLGMLDVNSKGLDDWTALHHAVNGRHTKIVQLLLEAKANPNLSTHMGRTPLHLACLRCCLEIVQMLIAVSVNLNCQDSDFNTPLHIASEFGQEGIVKLLVNSGAQADIKNYQQKTAYDVTMSLNIRNLLKAYNPTCISTYNSRTEMQGMVVRNSRADHIEKLLGKVNDLQKHKSQIQIQQQQQGIIEEARLMEVEVKMSSPDCYIFHKLLGKGSFGEVYLATHKESGELFAIKTLNKERVFSKNLIRYAQTEKNVLSVMKHPFIVRLHAAFQTQAKLFMVLDYCPGGDLGGLLSQHTKLPEEKARFFISEIILALEELHKNCIIFRDLKPDNVVLDQNGHARLTDFGLSKEGIYNNVTKSFCGSIAYLAPEVLMKRGHSRTVDWYLLGVLLYEMIVGIPPYYNQNREQLFDNIKKGVLKIPKTMSEEAKDLIKQLLIRDPAQRLGNKADAQDLKQHPFFNSVNWEEMEKKIHDGPYVTKDKSKAYLKERIEIKFDDPAIPNQRLQDWSFVQ